MATSMVRNNFHVEANNLSYVYLRFSLDQIGVGLLGCVSIYLLLKLMSETNVDFMHTTSVLGYCFLPIVLLASVSLVVELK